MPTLTLERPAENPREGLATPHLSIAGRRVDAVLRADGWLAFPLVPPVRAVRLRSARFCPATLGLSPDDRQLGFAVTGLEVAGAAIGLDHPALEAGFHHREFGGWRWTDGDAVLADGLFDAMREPGLLVVRGFGRAEAPWGASHRAVFLAGDSYPLDGHVERHLFDALHPFLAEGLVRQEAMLPGAGDGGHERALPPRLARLGQAVAGWAERLVLVGRSSGARAASLFAHRHGAAAVVCLGYPFQAPGGKPEPERHAHLAEIAVPTLVIQGRDDPYGGAGFIAGCPLSAQVSVQMVEGGHEFHLDAAGWAALGRRVARFVGGVG
ncbi:MAG: hypothetical protein IT555_06545 [Acetobacteraceae bacterium]|nr:hypothetical protein [Acetobacteraceae bacterium]